MKKIYLLILSLALAAAVAITAMASGTYTASLTADKTAANPGDEITVTVSVTAVTGRSGGLTVTYDEASLELTGGSFLIENTTLSDFSVPQKDGVFVLSSGKEISGGFARLTFKVKGDAPFNPTKITMQTKVGSVAAEATVSVSVVCSHNYEGMAWTASEEDAHTHTRTCKICNIPETKEHNWAVTEETKATCGQEGSKKLKCSDCGAEKEETTPKLDKHTWDDGKVTKEATCGAAGEKLFTCSVCDGTNTEVIPKLEKHTWGDGKVTKKATCTAEGVTTFICSVCEDTKTETIAKLSHAFDHGCDPDCNNCGYTRKTSHSYLGEWTMDETGHWYACTICGHRDEEAEHVPGDEPTDWTSQNCTVCGYIIKPALGHTHTFEETWTTDDVSHWHTCTGCETKGEYADHHFTSSCDAVCDACGYTRQTEHTYYESLMSDKDGHWEQCRICGHKTELQPHAPNEQGICSDCGYKLEIPGHDHSYSADWQWDISGHWNSCECGEKSALQPHGWNEGKVIKKPTDTTDGARKYICDTCGAERTELIPAGTKIPVEIPWVLLVVVGGVIVCGIAIFVIVGVSGSRKKSGKYSEIV